LRGYDEREITVSGGLAMFQANAELRIPVVGPFGIELFIDAGNVWDRKQYLKAEQFVPRFNDDPLDAGDVRYNFGAGARVNLPFGPLRIDFTWSSRPDAWGPDRTIKKMKGVPQFAIGPSF